MVHSIAQRELMTAKNVVTCYNLLDLATQAGVNDFTEGIYHGKSDTPYEEAQRNQAEHLLDLASCQAGSHLLDIGCGYGRVVKAALQRGAEARGITISPTQVERCRANGLDVELLNYRDIPDSWDGTYDCIIANGSLEHFVQPRDAVAGRADEIYRQMFGTVYRLLNPRSQSGRFVTTAIHFGNFDIDPAEMLRLPHRFRRGSDAHHYALLVHGFGGFYPSLGQLERGAAGHFELVSEEDGTEDYRLTSEEWLHRLQHALHSDPWFLLRITGKTLRHPMQSLELLDCLLIAQSWNWQFRGPNPPMRLLRQTWQRINNSRSTNDSMNEGRSQFSTSM
jgi:cyclopropane-fatty-acyl-phospholipid synthase